MAPHMYKIIVGRYPTVVNSFIGDNAISSLHRRTSENDSLDIREEISISL